MAELIAALTLTIKPKAQNDIRNIWLWNANYYSPQHAQRYVDYLYDRLQNLLADPQEGQKLPTRPNLRRLLIKSASARDGHIVVYRTMGPELQILRIFHTAQNWQSYYQ